VARYCEWPSTAELETEHSINKLHLASAPRPASYGAEAENLAGEAAAKAAVERAIEVFGRLDVVVNNAGYGDVAPFEQLNSESFHALVNTNFFGVVYMTRAAITVMRKQKSGCILQISSVGGRLEVPGNAASSMI
jgi:NAD(P)-dependent dehydrogenase (short-subunit alcohol dehydrogenase family)